MSVIHPKEKSDFLKNFSSTDFAGLLLLCGFSENLQNFIITKDIFRKLCLNCDYFNSRKEKDHSFLRYFLKKNLSKIIESVETLKSKDIDDPNLMTAFKTLPADDLEKNECSSIFINKADDLEKIESNVINNASSCASTEISVNFDDYSSESNDNSCNAINGHNLMTNFGTLDADSLDEIEYSSSSTNSSGSSRGPYNISGKDFLKISLQEYYEIVDRNSLELTSDYLYFLKPKLEKHTKCIIAGKGKSKLTKFLYKVRLYCIHPNCRKFNLFIPHLPEDVKFVDLLLTIEGEKCHNQLLTGQVRGKKRKILKEELIKIFPQEYRAKCIKNTDLKLLVEEKNLQNIISDATARKIRSDALQDRDLHKDDFQDVCLMMEQEKNSSDRYIQVVAKDLDIHLFSKMQIKVIQNLKSYDVLCHLDSTGGIVRNLKEASQMIYYYALVVNTPIGRTLAICERISSKHDQISITYWLGNFKRLCEQLNAWPLFGTIVTDWSLALINSSCLTFNNMDLIDYINVIYEAVEEGLSTLGAGKIILKVCHAHYQHNVTCEISKHFADKSIATNIKEIVSYLYDVTRYENVKHWAALICELLLRPKKDSALNDAFINLTKLCVDPDYSHMGQTEENSDIQHEDTNINYKNSMFYQKFDEIHQTVLRNINDTDPQRITNPYYSPTFLELLKKRYMPFLPLFSKIMHDGKGYNFEPGKHITNGRVEGHFKNVKCDILGSNIELGGAPVKIGRLIQLLKAKREIICTEIQYKIPKSRCASRNLKKAKDNVEIWNKRNKPTKASMRHTYCDRKQLKKIFNANKVAEVLKATTTKPAVRIVKQKLKFLQNRVISNKERYTTKIKEVNYLVCSRVGDSNIGQRYKYPLKQSDYEALITGDKYSTSKWLNDNHMSFFIDVFLEDTQRQDILVIDAIISDAFMTGCYRKSESERIEIAKRLPFYLQLTENTNVLVIPLCIDAHWCVAFVNLSKKIIIYFDPQPEEISGNRREIFEAGFDAYIFMYNIKATQKNWKKLSNEGWIHEKCTYVNDQDDSWSCGYRVLAAIEHFLSNNDMITFNPKEYRERLAKMCLNRSNGKDFCLYCCDESDITKGDIRWVYCDNCTSKMHQTCAIYYHKLPEKTSFEKLYFICLVCRK